MDIIHGIELVFKFLMNCMAYTFPFGKYSFTLGAAIIGGMLLSISLTLLYFMLRKQVCYVSEYCFSCPCCPYGSFTCMAPQEVEKCLTWFCLYLPSALWSAP